jgi:hypothetical protein
MSSPFSLFWDEIEFPNPKDNGMSIIIYPKEDAQIQPLKEKAILMQSTGLNDKNGKEIFEGDILKDKMKNRWILWRKKTCNYYYGALEEKHDNHGVLFDQDSINISDFKVVGNIYENPELLVSYDNKTEQTRRSDTRQSLSCDNKTEQEMGCPACEKYHAKINTLIKEKKTLEDRLKLSEQKYNHLKTSRKCRKKWQKKMDKKMVTCEICGRRVMVAEKFGSKIVCMKCRHGENIWTG